MIEADSSGRPPLEKGLPKSGKHLLELANKIDIVHEPTPDIVMGRHLIEMGMKPGEEFGRVLRAARNAQDNDVFNDLNGGKMFVAPLVIANKKINKNHG